MIQPYPPTMLQLVVVVRTTAAAATPTVRIMIAIPQSPPPLSLLYEDQSIASSPDDP